ncbi:MAG: Maf family protein [Candidatus Margulisbacteria bacterium]|jgi:septum formation protein|nr:Maf family protein [Candidatus Margulisiibacteriota bacterium]
MLSRLQRRYKIVLVSRSPRRRVLLKGLGLAFTVFAPQTAEHIRPRNYKQDLVKVTLAKINSAPCGQGQLLLACDTIVVCRGRVLGKPRAPKQAAEFLRLLSGKKHTVYSCVALKFLRHGRPVIRHKTVATEVFFRQITGRELRDYLQTPVPYDKAGAYGIQDTRGLFVRKINGCYYNVVGLPVSALIDMLKAV